MCNAYPSFLIFDLNYGYVDQSPNNRFPSKFNCCILNWEHFFRVILKILILDCIIYSYYNWMHHRCGETRPRGFALLGKGLGRQNYRQFLVELHYTDIFLSESELNWTGEETWYKIRPNKAGPEERRVGGARRCWERVLQRKE